MVAFATLFLGLGLATQASAARWANPGDACTQAGATANSESFMTCTGGVWVANGAQLGNNASACAAGTAGYLRWTGTQFEGCDGSSWIQLVSSGKPTYLGVTSSTYTGSSVGGWHGANAKCIAEYGAGARMMTAEDITKLGRSSDYPASGWIDCRANYYGPDAAYGCMGKSTAQVSYLSIDCSNFTSGVSSLAGTLLATNGNVGVGTCGTSYAIHCAKD